MKLNLCEKLEKYVMYQVDSGNFKNVNEVVEDALNLHQHYQQKRTSLLVKEIEKGWNGPASPRSIDDIIKAKLS